MVSEPGEGRELEGVSEGWGLPGCAEDFRPKEVVVDEGFEAPVFACLGFMPVRDRVVPAVVGEVNDGFGALEAVDDWQVDIKV
jgi:hypothetical protein